MSNYNEKYYIVFEKHSDDTLYLVTHDRSDYRNYEYTKLVYGEPMFFENSYKDKDLIRGVSRPIKKAHLDVTYPIVSDEIKRSLGEVENRTFQFYPSIIVDDKGGYHDDYWVFNVFNQLDALDLDKCRIDDFDPDESCHDIEKYFLSSEKLSLIPESERLVFMPDYSDVGHVMVHESLVKVFKDHNVDTLNFVKVSDWVMGYQFRDKA
ncbi:hypothetical protein L4C34_18730 [Vibrio profundum]|uniref:imm11 family protein n=1 Tax=Vibrio profundum TaxID=2910247 RepID=UPI003D122A89